MKYNVTKLLILTLVIYLLVLMTNIPDEMYSLKAYLPHNNELSVYTTAPLSTDSIDAGIFYITKGGADVSCDILGESAIISEYDLHSTLLRLRVSIYSSTYIDELRYTILCGRSPLLPSTGRRANIQIAIYDERAVIGWPKILGSY